MQNSVINKVNVATRILILQICSLIILLANSIYLIGFMSILFIVLLLLTNKNVKFYTNLIKKIITLLLFIFIAYIIYSRNILSSFVFIYKIILVILYIKQFSLTVNFNKFTSGIKTLFNSLKINKLDMISYNIVIFIYFIKYYINSKDEIFVNYNNNQKIMYIFSLKYNFLPRLFLSVSKVKKLESTLKLKYFSARLEQRNTLSTVILILFILLFIVVMFKEVIF